MQLGSEKATKNLKNPSPKYYLVPWPVMYISYITYVELTSPSGKFSTTPFAESENLKWFLQVSQIPEGTLVSFMSSDVKTVLTLGSSSFSFNSCEQFLVDFLKHTIRRDLMNKNKCNFVFIITENSFQDTFCVRMFDSYIFFCGRRT